MKVRQRDGTNKKFVIEVKPKAQCKEPVKNPKRRTKKWLNEVFTYAVNQASGNQQKSSVKIMEWSSRYSLKTICSLSINNTWQSKTSYNRYNRLQR